MQQQLLLTKTNKKILIKLLFQRQVVLPNRQQVHKIITLTILSIIIIIVITLIIILVIKRIQIINL